MGANFHAFMIWCAILMNYDCVNVFNSILEHFRADVM